MSVLFLNRTSPLPGILSCGPLDNDEFDSVSFNPALRTHGYVSVCTLGSVIINEPGVITDTKLSVNLGNQKYRKVYGVSTVTNW